MATFTQNQTRARRKVEGAKARAREAARRFQLPFGVIGKDSSFKRALAAITLVSPDILVIQDASLLVPPEYIFGIEPGDCVSLQTLFSSVRSDFFKDVDLAVSLYRPALVVVSSPAEDDDLAAETLLGFMDQLESSCPLLKQEIRLGAMEMEGCLVRARARGVEFLGRSWRYSRDRKVSSDAVAP